MKKLVLVCGLAAMFACAAASAQKSPAPPKGQPPEKAPTALDKAVQVPRGDPAMESALKRAHDSLDGFLELAAAAPAHVKSASVKVRVREGKNVEDFWVTPFRPEGGAYGGFLRNQPATIRKYKMGDPMRFTKGDIVDWMYMDDKRKRLVGNYTGCAVLAKRPVAERENARVQFGLECEG